MGGGLRRVWTGQDWDVNWYLFPLCADRPPTHVPFLLRGLRQAIGTLPALTSLDVAYNKISVLPHSLIDIAGNLNYFGCDRLAFDLSGVDGCRWSAGVTCNPLTHSTLLFSPGLAFLQCQRGRKSLIGAAADPVHRPRGLDGRPEQRLHADREALERTPLSSAWLPWVWDPGVWVHAGSFSVDVWL